MQIVLEGHTAVLHLRGGKANAMNEAFLRGLGRLFDEVAQSAARAVVITGYDKFFSAGLALPVLIDLPRDEMRAFMALFGETMLRVFACPLPVVAAINGHAIAGGCVLALQADVRLMADGPLRIGLNETQLGIGLPPVVTEPLRLAVPASSLVPLALQGLLVAPGEALRMGLVDELCAADQVLPRALARADELGRIPPAAFAQVKAALRQPARMAIEAARDRDGDAWLDSWYAPAAQALLRAAVAKLA